MSVTRLAIALLTLLSACGKSLSFGVPVADAPTVAFDELMAHPNLYTGKTIRCTGYYRLRPEDSALWASSGAIDEHDKMRSIVIPMDDKHLPPNIAHSLSDHRVAVTGTFIVGNRALLQESAFVPLYYMASQ